MIRRPPRSTRVRSSAASDVYKRQVLTGFRLKTGIWGIIILLVIFTPLTFLLALTNPVSDCGCFGDAIHLTNWQTFGKNIVLCILLIINYKGWNKFQSALNRTYEWVII